MTKESSGNEITFQELIAKFSLWLKFILTKWKFIFAIGLAGVLLGVLVSYIQKPSYTAELTFALEEKTNGGGALGAYAGLASQFGIDVGAGGGGAFSGDNMIELLKSRLLLQKTLLTRVSINNKSELLLDRFLLNQGYRNRWKNKPWLANITFDETHPELFTITQDSILSVVIKKIKLDQLSIQKNDKKLNIVNVKLVSTDELFAKFFTQELVKNVSAFYIETKTKKSRSNVELLQKRTDSVKNELDREMYGAAINQDQNLNVIRAQARVSGVKKQMNVQMLSAMYGELVKNLEFSKLALMREEPYIQVIDIPVLPLTKEKLGLVKASVLFGMLFAFLAVIIVTVQSLIKSLK